VTGSCQDCLEQPRPKRTSKIPKIPTIFIELNLSAEHHDLQITDLQITGSANVQPWLSAEPRHPTSAVFLYPEKFYAHWRERQKAWVPQFRVIAD
jgi:hypothetical protein